jgi:hypothetical protein
LTLLLALFRGVKYIFHSCNGGYRLELLYCEKEKSHQAIEIIGYGDLVKVWRKWFMLMIWLVASQMIVALLFIEEWFSIFMLYAYILIAGYFSFMIFTAKCKRVRVKKC